MDKKDFDPDSMVKWTRTMAAEAAKEMTQQERLYIIRSIVQAFVDQNVIDQTTQERASSFNAAAQTLYMCNLMLIIFPEAYAGATEHLEAIRKLNKSFEL